MPCKGRYEYNIRKAPIKQKAQEQRALRRVAPWKHLWWNLNRRVQNTIRGFDGLSESEQTYFAVELLDREVWVSGFAEYFSKYSDSYYEYARLGLIEMGSTEAAGWLFRAKAGAFSFGDILERDHGPMARQHYMEIHDKLYREQCFDIALRSAAFAQKHHFV